MAAQSIRDAALPVTRGSSGGGGASSPLTTKGDLWGYDTADARLPVGSDGHVLTADRAEALGVKWSAAAGGAAAGAAVWSYLGTDNLPAGAAAPEAVWQFDGTASSLDDRTANGTVEYTASRGLIGAASDDSYALKDSAPAGLRTTGAFTAEFLVSLSRDRSATSYFLLSHGTTENEEDNNQHKHHNLQKN